MRYLLSLAAFCVGAVLPWTAGANSGRTRVIRTWPDEVVVDGRTLLGRIEIVFDYGAGRAREVSYDADRREVKRLLLPLGFQPAPCPEEIAEARDAVVGDRELLGILRRTGGVLEDGVLLQGPDGPCGPGSRCLQVQMTTADRTGTIRFVVYNLASRTFVSRDDTPVSQGARP